MAEYRRFVAYVYEYQKEKKGSNCGFVKVEVRGEVCRIELHLQCPGMIPESKCSVYGFVRNRGLLDGIFLGSCITEEGKAECILETFAGHMGDGEKSLDDMGGMIFVTDKGGFFGTEWDDQPIRPGNVRMEQPENVQNEEMSQQELHSQSVQESESSNPISPESGEAVEVQKTPDQIPDEIFREHNRTYSPRLLPGTPCDAFPDGELSDCRKISLQDLCRMGRRACMLRNNRFVQYGSYNFGHLLLCRNNCGQMILGVPGGYDQQERFMANMFGFPYFKESRHIQIPGGRGGYWYRLIDSADSNNRNGRQ